MKRYFIFALICGLFVAASVVSGVQKEAQKSPSVFLPIKKFEFAPVLDGVQIQHTFAIQNKGTLPLDILRATYGLSRKKNIRSNSLSKRKAMEKISATRLSESLQRLVRNIF